MYSPIVLGGGSPKSASQVLKSRCWQDWFSLLLLREESVSLPFIASRGHLCFSAYDPSSLFEVYHSHLSSIIASSSLLLLSPPSLRTLVRTLSHHRHQDNPGSPPHLLSLNLIISAKSFLLCNIFTASRH